MLKIIEKIGHRYETYIKLEYDAENTVLFAHTQNAYHALNKISSRTEYITGTDSTLKKYLFLNNTIHPEPETNANFFLGAARTREEEIRYIAATIRELHLKKSVPLHKFGITFPDLEKYAA